MTRQIKALHDRLSSLHAINLLSRITVTRARLPAGQEDRFPAYCRAPSSSASTAGRARPGSGSAGRTVRRCAAAPGRHRYRRPGHIAAGRLPHPTAGWRLRTCRPGNGDEASLAAGGDASASPWPEA